MSCPTSAAPPVPPASSDVLDVPSTTFVLANGMTVIVHENHDAPLVAVNLVYAVGSKDEPPGRTGFAHLFEHLMFEGSEHAPGSYIDRLQAAGASGLNANTGRDRTMYFETVPTGSLDFALFMESDRMGYFHSTIDQAALDQQRSVVLNEKREKEAGPLGLLLEQRNKACFPAQHPYAHTVIGEAADLQAASLEEVRQWFRTWYTPSNVVLTLAGDIDPASARQKVETWFGHFPPGAPLARPRAWVPEIPWGRRDVFQARVQEGALVLAWNIPPYGEDDTTLLSIAANLLASGLAAPLVRRLVYEEAVASSALAGLDYGLLASQFVITVPARDGAALERIERLVDEELARFLAHDADEAALQRVKREMLDGFSGAHTTVAPIAELLSSSQLMLGAADGYRAILARIEAATAPQVRAAAVRWLTRARYAQQVLTFTAAQAGLPAADRRQPPPIQPPTALSLPPWQSACLDNGLKLVLVERHSHPELMLELILPRWPAAAPELATLAVDLLNSAGAGARNAFDFNSEARELGARLLVGQRGLHTSVSLRCRRSRLAAALALFADRLCRSVLAAEAAERTRVHLLARLSDLRTSADELVRRVLPGLMYPAGHPYRVPRGIAATRRGLERLQFEQVQAYARQMLQVSGGTLLVAGDTTLEEIVPLLNRALADWQPTLPPPARDGLGAPRPPAPRVFLLDVPGAAQSSLAAASLVPGTEWSEEADFTLLNQVLADGFTSRLNRNLREARNWTYGVDGMVMNDRGSRVHFAQTAVQADRTAQALAEIHGEYRALLGERPVGTAELDALRLPQLLRLSGAAEGLDGLGGMVGHLLRQQLPEDHWQRQMRAIAAADAGAINRLAQHCFAPQHLTWVVAGDLAQVGDAVQALALGEAQHIDATGDALYDPLPA